MNRRGTRKLFSGRCRMIGYAWGDPILQESFEEGDNG